MERSVGRRFNFKNIDLSEVGAIDIDIALAEKLAHKLNEQIEKGNDTPAFTIALLLALAKDFLDIVLAFVGIGFIPGVNFLVGLFLTTFLFIFMWGKGMLLRWRFKAMYWILGLFVDGLPVVSALPMNTILVVYAWRIAKKRKKHAEVRIKKLGLEDKQRMRRNLVMRELKRVDEESGYSEAA